MSPSTATHTCACGRRIRVKALHAGRRARCRYCRREFIIPSEHFSPTHLRRASAASWWRRGGRRRWVVVLGLGIIAITGKFGADQREDDRRSAKEAVWLKNAEAKAARPRRWTMTFDQEILSAVTYVVGQRPNHQLMYRVDRYCRSACSLRSVFELTWLDAAGGPVATLRLLPNTMAADTSAAGLSHLSLLGSQPVSLDRYLVAERWDVGSYPSGATAICRSGRVSFSASRRGTCSHHGGVARWLP